MRPMFRVRKGLIRMLVRIPLVARLGHRVARRRAGVHHVAAIGVVVNDDGRVLLAKHTFRNGAWGLPGGWVQRHEHPATAVAREIAEETGVAVDVEAIVASESHVAATRGRGPSGMTLAFACHAAPGSEPIVRSAELEDVAWFAADEARESLSVFEIQAVDLALAVLKARSGPNLERP